MRSCSFGGEMCDWKFNFARIPDDVRICFKHSEAERASPRIKVIKLFTNDLRLLPCEISTQVVIFVTTCVQSRLALSPSGPYYGGPYRRNTVIDIFGQIPPPWLVNTCAYRLFQAITTCYLRKLINIRVGEGNVPFCTTSLRGTHSTLEYSLLSGISSRLRRIGLITRFRHIIPIDSDRPMSCEQALVGMLCARF